MKTSIANQGAKKVKEMAENNEPLRYIKAFCEGYGFDINSYESAVCYIGELSRLCITIRKETFYYTIFKSQSWIIQTKQ